MYNILNDLTLIFHANFSNLLSIVINAIIGLIVGFIVCKIVKKITIKTLSKTSIDQSVIKFISSVLNILCLIVISLIVLSIFNFPLSSFTAIFGTIAIGLGIAFKESLANLGSGAILLISRQFKIGDYISSGNVEGTVHDMSVFTTSLKTIDNKVVMIPNSKLMSDSIINFSNQTMRRVDIRVTVPYCTDIPKLKSVLQAILDSDDRVLSDPEYIVGVRDFTDRGMVVIVTPWVLTSDYWHVYYDLMEKIAVEFNKNDIRISYNQVTVLKK